MEDLCLKLTDSEQARQTLQKARAAFAEVKNEIESTHQKLMQHPDKWKEFNSRSGFSFLFNIVSHLRQA